MDKILAGSLVLGLLLGQLPLAHAEEKVTLCEAAESDDYMTKTSGMFMRGVANGGLCWVELVNQPLKVSEKGTFFVFGIPQGVVYTFVRLGQGALEIFLSPFPKTEKRGFLRVTTDCTLGIIGLEER